jgi:hypothetical protein
MSLQRTLYLMSRAAGDARALQRGRLPQRLVGRVYHRNVIRVLRRWALW